MYQAIKEQNFLQADSLKEKINVLKEEISRLSENTETIVTDDNNMREEKSDAATMIKCLDILYNAIQFIRVLTPTLRSLMCFVLSSLDVSIGVTMCVLYTQFFYHLLFNPIYYFSILMMVYIY